jgi:hypothetical protein
MGFLTHDQRGPFRQFSRRSSDLQVLFSHVLAEFNAKPPRNNGAKVGRVNGGSAGFPARHPPAWIHHFRFEFVSIRVHSRLKISTSFSEARLQSA